MHSGACQWRCAELTHPPTASTGARREAVCVGAQLHSDFGRVAHSWAQQLAAQMCARLARVTNWQLESLLHRLLRRLAGRDGDGCRCCRDAAPRDMAEQMADQRAQRARAVAALLPASDAPGWGHVTECRDATVAGEAAADARACQMAEDAEIGLLWGVVEPARVVGSGGAVGGAACHTQYGAVGSAAAT
jgi:hypothetical protein